MRPNISYRYNCLVEPTLIRFIMVACILSWVGQTSAAIRGDIGKVQARRGVSLLYSQLLERQSISRWVLGGGANRTLWSKQWCPPNGV